LHCDLSVNNVLLNRKDNESQAIGLLIDYDYSLVAGPDSEAANHQNPCHTQAVGTAASVSGTYVAEGTSIGEKVVVEVPSDTSEGNVAVGAEKVQITRTVRCGHLLDCQVIMILQPGYTTIHGY
jgi:hypothetical protein